MLLQFILISTTISVFISNDIFGQPEQSCPSVNVSNNAQRNSKFNILVLGLDNVADLTDVVFIVSCDTVSHSMSVMQIPRDTYAEYSSAAYRKINAAAEILGGGREVADFIESTLCINIDRYVIIDTDALADMVDAVGGIEIYVPRDMNYSDPYQSLDINIKKGKQLMDGEKAVQFIRYREGYIRGDLDRLDTQKLFMASFVKKIANNGSISLFASVVDKVLNKLQSDLTYKDCFYLFTEIGMPSLDKIYFSTLPGCDIRSDNGTWYYIINRQAAFELIKNEFTPPLVISEFDTERKFTSRFRQDFNMIYDAKDGYKQISYTAEQLINFNG